MKHYTVHVVDEMREEMTSTSRDERSIELVRRLKNKLASEDGITRFAERVKARSTEWEMATPRPEKFGVSVFAPAGTFEDVARVLQEEHGCSKTQTRQHLIVETAWEEWSEVAPEPGQSVKERIVKKYESLLEDMFYKEIDQEIDTTKAAIDEMAERHKKEMAALEEEHQILLGMRKEIEREVEVLRALRAEATK